MNAFNTLVKTANEVLRRHEQRLHATLHKSLRLSNDISSWEITLDIVPDAWLSAIVESGEEVATVNVAALFDLNRASAERWVENEFARPK